MARRKAFNRRTQKGYAYNPKTKNYTIYRRLRDGRVRIVKVVDTLSEARKAIRRR